MTDTRQITVTAHLQRSARTFAALEAQTIPMILEAADMITESLKHGGKLLICGNGGSAADSQHMAAEFVSRLRADRPRAALSALALTTDTSFLTAYSNDEGYDGVFARQVEAHGKKGDVLFGITTSGTSKNILQAFAEAKKRNMATIGLTGAKGLGAEADCVIAVPGEDQQCTQEAHLAVEHIICELVEDHLFPRNNG